MTATFTERQLANFRFYVGLQKSGAYNMFDPRARAHTDMTVDEWCFNMTHYEDLEKAVQETARG